MMKKTLSALLALLMLVSLGACSFSGNDAKKKEDNSTEVLDTVKEDVKEQTANKEINISEFIGLDWKFEGLEYPCLSRDEILAYDKDAQYIGAVPGYSRPGPGYSFYIKSEGKTMFGYDGILYYRGGFEPTGAEENIVEYEHEFYSNCYKYTGDGSDIKFGSDMEFTITDVTLNQLLDIIDKAAKLADIDATEMKILYEDEYKKVSDIAEILSVKDYDAILENANFELSTRPVTVMQTDTHIYDMKIYLFGEKHFESDNYNRMELYPDADTAQNRVFIRIYSREKTASEAVASEKYISGKYIWDDPGISGEGSTPCIYFADDGDCILFVDYSEGGSDIEGRYYIADGKIYVNLDFSNTIFEDTGDEYTDIDFMADKYVFTIVNDSEIVINRGCYAVMANDKFVRS